MKKSVVYRSSIELSSFTELRAMNRDDPFRFKATRRYDILVLRGQDVIFTFGPIDWTRNGLNDGFDAIVLRFPEIPQNLRFLVRIYEFVKGGSVVKTDTVINSLLDGKYTRNQPDGNWSLRVNISPRKSLSLINTSAAKSSAAFFGKKTAPLFSGPRQKSAFNRNLTRTEPYSSRLTVTATGVDQTTFSNVNVIVQTVSSVRTPNYRALAAQGRLPNQPFAFNRAEFKKGSHTWVRIYSDATHVTSVSTRTITANPYLAINGSTASHLAMDENRLVSKLATRISGSNANIGEDLATASQTLKMFTSKVHILRSLFAAAKLGNLPKANRIVNIANSSRSGSQRKISKLKSIPRSLSSLWLEVQYGWKPLFSDIEALIGQFARLQVSKTQSFHVAAKIKKISDSRSPLSGTTDLTPTIPIGYYNYHTETSCQIGLNYQVDNLAVNMLANLGLTSPVLLAWELVPFSFVVDWFLPIGGALQSYSSFEGLTFLSGYKTYFTRESQALYYDDTRSVPFTPGPNGGQGLIERSTGGCSVDAVKCTRTVLTNFPTASFPRLKNPISTMHAANAVALLVQTLTRR